jgi:outer membrane lipoprotein-sorting protein
MRLKISLFFITVVVLIATGSVSFAEQSSKEILQNADRARGNLDGVKWIVQIVSHEDSRVQERVLEVQAKGYDFLAILADPAKVKGQKLLMKDRNMWFMKPGLRKPVPISPRQKLIGGAAYGDIAATNYAGDYDATVLPDETVAGESCYVFDLKAAHKRTTYDRIIYWVSKQRLVGIKAEFFTVSGKLFKKAVFEYKNKIMIDNNPNPFISKMIISDALLSENVTIMTFSQSRLETITDGIFDLNLLMMR